MASSDEEGEIVPDLVNSYWIENDKEELVSLSCLKLLWRISEIECDLEAKIFLRGTTDDGLQKIHKRIVGWRFELSYPQPEISVLSKDKNWITLQRPRKCFESTIRTILVTVYCLHFVKWNPEDSRISIWKKLQKDFRSFDVMPSENDILSYMMLIGEAAKRDKDLTKSKYLLDFMEKARSNEGLPKNNDVHRTKKSNFIVDSSEDEESDQSDGEQNIGYDTVCAICDNGGEILPCEGRCLRSFHATKEAAGIDGSCESLGYTSAQVKAFPNFYCENCKYKQHQCFACGKLGSSDVSSRAEVFPCVTANCGHYYHPKCVARLLCPGIGINSEQVEMKKRVAIGKAFICPLHICSLCKKGENKKVHDLQFAICRRCPKAYHRKCLPKEISFTFDYGIEQRAWDGLLGHRILIYCMDHEIDVELGTPARNHLVFPDLKVKRKIFNYKLLGKGKDTLNLGRSFEDLPPKKILVPNQVTKLSVKIQDGGSAKGKYTTNLGRSFEDLPPKKILVPDLVPNRVTKQSVKNQDGGSAKDMVKKDIRLSSGSVKFDMNRNHLKGKNMSLLNSSLPSHTKTSALKMKNANLSCKNSRLCEAKSLQQKLVGGRIQKTGLERPLVKKTQNSPAFNRADMENSVLSLMKETMSTFDEEEFKKKYITTSCATETAFVKNLTEGKVEGSVKAIQTALQRLDEGCSIEEAKAICDPGVLRQLFLWQSKLKVYLAPFLHGMRYTSFGRHFTKIDKLKEVVDRLHWYVQNGDTVLDFCCGSNDFSCLMKAKLEHMGKSCSFRNYDLFQPKNDFNFERRDWMSINPEELPNGSQLIIGLNPPFGVKSCLANKFIDKALTFKPKLLILIVPKVTKRLDRKNVGYDLIWEDDELFSGKSFYLPGSVDIRNKQLEDWNLKPPPLYLWSRPDWTTEHRKIAKMHCHIKGKYDMHVKGKDVKNYLMEKNHAPGNALCIFDDVPDDNGVNALKEGATSNVLGKLKEPVFSDCRREVEWEKELSSNEAEEMCIDMDLSSP